MTGPVVVGAPVESRVLLVGQAPGDKEPALGRPFAWTAGKQLFKWFNTIGLDEPSFRSRVYMAAVCRCFPGKNPKGGDRVPDDDEIAACAPWLAREVELLKPTLLIPVGRLAIGRFVPGAEDQQLTEIIGKTFRITVAGHELDAIPLPHPSGASTWHRMEPGMTLTKKALRRIAAHPAWKELLPAIAACK
jgi:uracil-DNA glycosylase